jgi:hypothetical protein
MQTTCRFFRAITTGFIFSMAIYGGAASPQSIPGVPANYLVLPGKTYTIPFYWQGDSVNSKWEAHAALLLPVQLQHCPKLFYMQFDLGAPSSLLYKNKLEAIRLQYPAAIPPGEPGNKLIDFSFTIAKMAVLAKEITIKQFDSSGIDWTHKKSIEIIGTIGADLIDGKTAVIDYPGKKLTLASAVPAKLAPRLSLTNFVYAGRSVLLPAIIRQKQVLLYFDTGSSMYELLTDKKTCEDLAAPGSKFARGKAGSWGKELIANSIASGDSIAVGGTVIPLQYATYIEGVDSARVAQMMKMGIGGMTGNKLFLKYKLVLDTKNKKMGLVPGGK